MNKFFMFFKHSARNISTKIGIFPSIEYLELVQKSNEKWLSNAFRPFVHNPTQTRVYVLGTLQINIPVSKTIPFSADTKLEFQSAVAVQELWNDLTEKYENKAIKSSRFTLVLNETVQQTNWLVNEYMPFYRLYFENNSIDIDSFFRRSQNIINRSNTFMDIGLDIPHDWIGLMESSHLLPNVEPIAAINALQEFNSPHEILHPKVSCIALEESLEYQKYKDETEKVKALFPIKQGAESNSNVEILDSLADFYESFYGISKETMGKIDTGCIAADSLIQKMIIHPQDMKTYCDIIFRSSASLNSSFRQRIIEKAARENVRIVNIIETIKANLNGDNYLLIVDRDLLPGIATMLWSNQFERL
jgi:hypothetical protein